MRPGAESIQARPLTLADLDAVMAIEVRAYPWPWSRGNFVDSLAAGHWGLGLWCPPTDGDPPTLAAYAWAMEGVDEMHLLNITVAPEWQRRGLARQLLSRLKDECRRLGAARLWLEVRAGNSAARRLYEASGFAAVGLRRAYYPDRHGRREDAVVMCCEVLAARGEGEVPGVATAEVRHALD